MAPKPPSPVITITQNPLLFTDRKPEKADIAKSVIFKTDCCQNIDGKIGKILIYKKLARSDEISRSTSPIDSKEPATKQINVNLNSDKVLTKEKWNKICSVVIKCFNYLWGQEIGSYFNKTSQITFEIYPGYALVNAKDLEVNKAIRTEFITQDTIKAGDKTIDGIPHADLKEVLDELSNESGVNYIEAIVHDPEVTTVNKS